MSQDTPQSGKEAEAKRIKHLTSDQRRVLGTLSEKAFTTQTSYPLTLRSLVTGCSQKSNRDPVYEYDDGDILLALDQLKDLELVGIIYPDSGGQALRYRHYLRKKFPFSEPQLAIMTELLLRGRQTLGELRARASRMVPIDTLDQLRDEVQSLLDQGYLQANASLDKRGVEVDHNLYQPGETKPMAPLAEVASAPQVASATGTAPPAGQVATQEIQKLEEAIADLRVENRELKQELESLRDKVEELTDGLEVLRRDLGG